MEIKKRVLIKVAVKMILKVVLMSKEEREKLFDTLNRLNVFDDNIKELSKMMLDTVLPSGKPKGKTRENQK